MWPVALGCLEVLWMDTRGEDETCAVSSETSFLIMRSLHFGRMVVRKSMS